MSNFRQPVCFATERRRAAAAAGREDGRESRERSMAGGEGRAVHTQAANAAAPRGGRRAPGGVSTG